MRPPDVSGSGPQSSARPRDRRAFVPRRVCCCCWVCAACNVCGVCRPSRTAPEHGLTPDSGWGCAVRKRGRGRVERAALVRPGVPGRG
eukprot:5166522-Prymnesium_polylepis.1